MDSAIEEKRLAKRLRFSESVKIQTLDQGKVDGSLASNISKSGIMINLFDFVPLHDQLWLSIMGQSGKMIDCIGEVVWCQRVPFSDRYQAGIKFSENDNLKIIQHFVESNLIDGKEVSERS